MSKKRIIKECIKYIKDEKNSDTDVLLAELSSNYDDFEKDLLILIKDECENKIASWEYGIPHLLQNFPKSEDIFDVVIKNLNGKDLYDYLLSLTLHADKVDSQVNWAFHDYLVGLVNKYGYGDCVSKLEDALDQGNFEAATSEEWKEELEKYLLSN